jgi:hypothetical protein
MKSRRGRWHRGERGFERDLALLELVELGLKSRAPQPLGNGLNHPAQLPADIVKLALLNPLVRLAVAALPVHLAVELGDELLDQLGRHEPVLEPVRISPSRTGRLMLRLLLQVPWRRAAEQER